MPAGNFSKAYEASDGSFVEQNIIQKNSSQHAEFSIELSLTEKTFRQGSFQPGNRIPGARFSCVENRILTEQSERRREKTESQNCRQLDCRAFHSAGHAAQGGAAHPWERRILPARSS